jgi:hypothetical protein
MSSPQEKCGHWSLLRAELCATSSGRSELYPVIYLLFRLFWTARSSICICS